MNCQAIGELLPGYALGALDPDEVKDVETHLRDCREHDQEMVELRATVFALDRYREDLVATPSPALAGRIRSITAEKREGRGWSLPRLGAMAPLWRGAVALAVALLVFGAGWVASGVLTDSGTAYAIAIQGEGGTFMEMRGDTSEESVTVTMANLERAPQGSAYQVWAIRDGEWVSVGTCNTNANGWWRGDFDFQMREDEVVALTIEPSGGSASPSSEPVLRSVPED